MSRAGGTRAGGTRGTNRPLRSQPGTSGTQRSQQRTGTAGSGLSALSEGESYQGTEFTGVAQRAQYKPPQGYFSPSLARFEKYLEDTQVQVLFQRLLYMLLNRPELPYNPFPGFYGRLRMNMEKFHLEREPSEKIQYRLRNSLQETYLQNLFTIRGFDNVWGTRSILRVINPTTIERYRWLVYDVSPDLDQLHTTDQYSNQVMVSLIGPCVFDGSLYPGCHNVQLRLEYLVTGPDVAHGISIFVNSVMSDIDDMFQSDHHFLLGVSVPTASDSSPDNWVKHYWEPEKIQDDKAGFLQKLSDAVIGNKYIYVECVFLLDPNYPSYVKGEKQYGFNFIEVVMEMKEEGLRYGRSYVRHEGKLSSFCEFPMASLHEGVFLERAHAEAYISIFQPQMDDFEEGSQTDRENGVAPSPGVTPGPYTSRPQTRQERTATAMSKNRRFSVSQEKSVNRLQKHVHGRLEHIKPRRVKIDGFKYGDETNTGPYAWQVTSPIKAVYQRKIAGYWKEAELFDIVYCVLILVLIDRESFDEDILIEIYRLLHGTAGRMHVLMEYNKALRATIQAIANTKDYPVIRPLLARYRDAVADIFINRLLERSQDHVTIGRSIYAKVSDMIYCEDLEFASASHLQMTLRGLKNINLYSVPLMMELAEDSLNRCPQLDNFIKTMHQTFPDDNPRPLTRYKRQQPTSFQLGEDEIKQSDVKHGYENEHIKKHETSVLNVKHCMERDGSPQTIMKDSVLLKYMIDTHVDEMWSDYLIDLAGGDVFPPNPFPRLITKLRQCAMRMDLFFEKSSSLEGKLFNKPEMVPLEDPDNYVYQVPGLDAHGTLTALIMLDTGAYAEQSKIIHTFQQKNFIQKKGPYRVGICLALSGPSIWYGKMQPYLNEIELHEHYYIQGPQGCAGEAIQLCAVIVHNHMVDMINKSGLPVMGVYFGSPSPDHWTSDDILSNKRGFLTEFATVCGQKEPIYARAYVVMDDWRYVMMTKHFKLHFIESGGRSSTFYPDDPASFYQSVFLSKERAAFHFQNYGPPQGGDPLSVANVNAITVVLGKKMSECQRRCDWLNFYRNMLLRDLVSRDQSHIADTWRVLHSMAGQIEYVIRMMEVLQDIVLTDLQSQIQKTSGGSRQGSKQNQGKNPVDHKILSKMVLGFYQKLMYVCEARLTMASRAIPEFIENKLKSALIFDPDTGQPFVAIEDQTLFRLEEMKSMLLIYQDILGGDIQSVCGEVTMQYRPPRQRTPQMVLDFAPVKTPNTSSTQVTGSRQGSLRPDPYMREPDMHRPPSTAQRGASVASTVLDDPDFYRKRPAKMRTIHE